MKIITFLLLSLSLIGCGPKVTPRPEGALVPKAIALLPATTDADVTRERIRTIEDAVANELKGHGFIVLERATIERSCGGDACPRRSELFSQYSLDGVVALKIDTAAKTNFLAGYVNVLSGTLTLLSRTGETITEVEHTESERGGLIFNSGQLFEGIKSQVTETSSDSFGKLAENFAATVVHALPRPEQASVQNRQSQTMKPNVSSVSLAPFKRSAYKICARGTPDLTASLVSRYGRSTLRETTAGDYCGVFTIRGNSATRAAKSVEIRSAYGESAQREIATSFPETCNLTDVNVNRNGSTGTLMLSCVSPPESKAGVQCEQQLALCARSRLIAYGATSESGPYRKIGEFEGRTLEKTALKGAPLPPLVEIIALDKSGYTSPPFRVLARSTDNAGSAS